MSTKSWNISRRELLKGGGIALALPFLNAMSNTLSAATAKPLPKRMCVTYFAYGCYMPGAENGVPIKGKPHDDWSWWPCLEAGPLTFNQSSAPFESLKEYVSYLRGLDHKGGWKLGGHSSGDIFATGADMGETQLTNGISIDQVAANALGHHTRHASLVLGTEGGTGSYGMSKTLSHRGPGRPIPAMQKPQEIFNMLFAPYGNKSVEEVRANLKREASIIDLLLENSRSLKGRLGREDTAKMDEYMESIRAIEKRVERSSLWTQQPLPNVDTKGLNLEVAYNQPKEYIRCMYDLIYLAFQTDSTRFATLMLESESSSTGETWNYANYVLGYKGATHDIAHKRPADFSGQWDKWRAEQHAYFLQRLKETPEGDGNMLDRTLVIWGSAHPHGSHSNQNYPIQFAGGNKLGFKHGNLHDFIGDKKVPFANLYLTMLQSLDLPVQKFADSTGIMSQLRA